jgi:hypothetical protein
MNRQDAYRLAGFDLSKASCGKQITIVPCNLQVLACGRLIVANAGSPHVEYYGDVKL